MKSNSLDEVSVWQKKAPPVGFKSGSVHLWCCDLSLDHPVNLNHLSSDEQARAQRLIVPHKRKQFITSRSFLRRVLAAYLELEPLSIQLDYGDQGKPRLAATHSSVIRFNLSHSGELAVLAVAQEFEIGIDIEKIDLQFDFMPIAQRFFCASDFKRLQDTSELRRRRLFYRIWTGIESLGKLTGEGIFASFAGQSTAFSRPIVVAPNYVCTLAAENSPERIARFYF